MKDVFSEIHITVTNPTDEYKRACVLGNKSMWKFDQPTRKSRSGLGRFLNIDTDEEVRVEISGGCSEHELFEYVTQHGFISFGKVNYYSTTKLPNVFWVISRDSMGDIDIKTIIPIARPTQDTLYPIDITSKKVSTFHWNTSFLFELAPNESIKLSFLK